MGASRKFPLRFALYFITVSYLISDFYIFCGPIRRRFNLADSNYPTAVKTLDAVAYVSGQPITSKQLDRALSERLWLDGKKASDLTADDLQLARRAALEELIDHQLLRQQVKALGPQLTVSASEIDERLRRLVGRFETKGALETAMKTQGIPKEQDLRARLTARIQQEKFIALRIAPFVQVASEEALEWFIKNQQVLSLPERIKIRHIFIPALDRPPEEAKQKLGIALNELTEKINDFDSLAKDISEDPATKNLGGELGWMTRDRMPTDLAAAVFALELNRPALVRTKLGWHLVEVTARRSAELRTFEQTKPEIVNALETLKRQTATKELRQTLRKLKTAEIVFPVNPSDL